MPNKSEVIQKLIQLAERQTGRLFKTLRADNGTDFINKVELPASKVIKHNEQDVRELTEAPSLMLDTSTSSHISSSV